MSAKTCTVEFHPVGWVRDGADKLFTVNAGFPADLSLEFANCCVNAIVNIMSNAEMNEEFHQPTMWAVHVLARLAEASIESVGARV